MPCGHSVESWGFDSTRFVGVLRCFGWELGVFVGLEVGVFVVFGLRFVNRDYKTWDGI